MNFFIEIYRRTIENKFITYFIIIQRTIIYQYKT